MNLEKYFIFYSDVSIWILYYIYLYLLFYMIFEILISISDFDIGLIEL